MFIEQYFLGKKNAWRYLVGLIALVVAILVGQIPMGITLVVLQEFNPSYAAELKNGLQNISESGISSNILFFFNLIPFLFAFFALYIVMKYLHERPAITVATSRPHFDISKFTFAALTWLGLSILMELIFYIIFPDNYVYAFDFNQFIPLLLITFFLIPFQSAFEELAVRGYLLQAFGGWFKYRWIAILLTSLLFASLHLSNPEFREFGLGVGIYYIIFAIIAATIAVIDGGLEIPIAIHITNNMYGALLVSFEGSVFSTATIFKVERIELSTMLIGWSLMLVMYIIVLQLRYKWTNWKIVFEKVDENFHV